MEPGWKFTKLLRVGCISGSFGKVFPSKIVGCFQNRGTPKSSILIGFSIINHPFWRFSPYFWKHPVEDDSKHHTSQCWSFFWLARKVGNEGSFITIISRYSFIPSVSTKGHPVFCYYSSSSSGRGDGHDSQRLWWWCRRCTSLQVFADLQMKSC